MQVTLTIQAIFLVRLYFITRCKDVAVIRNPVVDWPFRNRDGHKIKVHNLGACERRGIQITKLQKDWHKCDVTHNLQNSVNLNNILVSNYVPEMLPTDCSIYDIFRRESLFANMFYFNMMILIKIKRLQIIKSTNYLWKSRTHTDHLYNRRFMYYAQKYLCL